MKKIPKREYISFGGEIFLKADKKAAVVYVDGDPIRTYYRLNGGLNEKKVCVDLVANFSIREPYLTFKTCVRLARYIASEKVTCDCI